MNKDRKIEVQNNLITKLQNENEELKEALEYEKAKPKNSIQEAKNFMMQLEEEKRKYEELVAELEEMKVQYRKKLSEIDSIKKQLKKKISEKYTL